MTTSTFNLFYTYGYIIAVDFISTNQENSRPDGIMRKLTLYEMINELYTFVCMYINNIIYTILPFCLHIFFFFFDEFIKK